MNCLPIETIHRYLEGDVSPEDVSAIESHLEACPSCRAAVEERARLTEAASSLIFWRTPAGFAQQTMARILKRTASAWSPFLAIAAGFATSALLVFGYLSLTGQTLAGFFTNTSRLFLSVVKTISVGTVKTFKLLSILVKAVWQLGSVIVSGLGKISGLMSTEFQIALILTAGLLYYLLFMGIRRKLFAGEKI